MSVDLLAHFPAGARPRPEQRRLLVALADALAEIEDDPRAPRVLLVEAPPGVGKSHLAMTLARWSGDAYLLTSQKLLQDQYEREFGGELALVKGRDNYVCERYPGAAVPTSRGMCRRARGPACACPYVRAKQAAVNAPIFCTNTAYFATLRHWHAEHLRRRRLLVIDEAHNLESQLVGVFTARFSHDEMREWFGAPLPRLAAADDYRPVLAEQVERLEGRRQEIVRALEAVRPPTLPDDVFLESPPTREEQTLLEQRDQLDAALARLTFFLEAEDREWIVRYPEAPAAALSLVPLTVAAMARALLAECADVTVLSSAYLGHREILAECFELDPADVRVFTVGSPFALERRPIVYRPVGALSRATAALLLPALFAEVATILAAHPDDKGLIHVASYEMGRRLVHDLAARAPRESQRLLWIDSASGKTPALEHHRASPLPTVLVSPSLREGVDLPDDFLRFQIVTKLPYPDLGDPWTAARRQRDPRWYAVETAKALLQAYGRSCRHAEDHGVTYVLDAQFARFVQHYRVLLPEWFLDAAEPALRALARGGEC
ncbi:MAG TPA: helicase C-terminal domain-containing protein [Methylomirabilota bacterium]|nr:helicase C-terminal domain-containing protein [Methylomirabilota bacterium]